MTDKKTLLLAQLFITFQMAVSMSGIMSLFQLGLTMEWLMAWPGQFIIAWPIAFIFTMVASRVGFALAHKVTGTRRA